MIKQQQYSYIQTKPWNVLSRFSIYIKLQCGYFQLHSVKDLYAQSILKGTYSSHIPCFMGYTYIRAPFRAAVMP